MDKRIGVPFPQRMPIKDSYKNTIEVQSQGTYFLLRFSNRKKWSFCNKSGSKACSINKNVGEVRHTSSTARQGLSDPAAGISTLTDNWARYNTCHLYAQHTYNTTIIIFCHQNITLIFNRHVSVIK